MVKNLPSSAGDMGLISGQGTNIPLSVHTATREACVLQPRPGAGVGMGLSIPETPVQTPSPPRAFQGQDGLRRDVGAGAGQRDQLCVLLVIRWSGADSLSEGGKLMTIIHRVEFEEVSGPRVLIKRGPGNRGPSECGTTHEATSGMSS